ncbi:TIR domain-containing protein, partial [Frankia sp. CNm7]|uniref:TIR domain-containing protein n=1 Tax=Frankia nepalensis TaxID=1836974 RepID=UPI001933B87D
MSYAGEDVRWAEWVTWTLEDAGHDVRSAVWDFGPGSHPVGEMHRALAEDRRMVAVVSAAYAESVSAAEEWQAVWAADPAGTKRRLLIVRVEDCDRPGLLRQIAPVDIFGVAKDAARQRLLDAIEWRRDRPEVPPSFPGEVTGPGIGVPSPGASQLSVPAAMARSAYLEQVRQIAPPCLTGREAELARLAEFCTAPDDATSRSFLWWRAPAWTGKSALLSSFVLAPPPSVRVVSFFITARYAGNSDRDAFVEVVTEQLTELLGESEPPFVNPGRRERLWFKFFADAAASCQALGQRLVLVVDGLDEDRGVTTRPEARSIAGLLPASPPYGARVVVAGRPDPPIPADVPAGHPLRDPGIIRVLDQSIHAAVLKADMYADLDRLRTGSPLGQDLLGLVTAAEGGLSSHDLEELAADPGATERDIDRFLSTVAGRSFASRPAQWNPNSGPPVYLLGHEELQQDAVRSFGPRRLAAYRERLHTWADEYRQRQWPSHTPEYLLRGYYRLLLATGDLVRAVDCATDQARHDRMLDLTGGDTAALAEVTDAQNAILGQPSPDLALMAQVAVHRQRIAARNSNIPTHLPAVWARLRHATRAEQLACGITNLDTRAVALVSVVVALAEAGDHVRAEQVARKIIEPYFQTLALADLARVLLRTGEDTRAAQIVADAEQVAHGTLDPYYQARALAKVAGALAEASEIGHAELVAGDAERLARGVTLPRLQVLALADVAGAHALTGQDARAEQVAADAEEHAYGIPDPDSQDLALADLAAAFARAGALARAERVARSIPDTYFHEFALADLAGALAGAGQHARAEQVARGLTDQYCQARALANVAGALGEARERSRAQQVAAEAERVARGITDPHNRTRALADVTAALADASALGHAEEVARDITDPNYRAPALAKVAHALAQAGERVRAEQVAIAAEHVARGMANPHTQIRAFANLATALAHVGERVRAEQVAIAAEHVAREMDYLPSRAEALADVASALADAGELTRAEQIAAGAEQIAHTVTNPFHEGLALVAVVAVYIRVGELARAEQLARDITEPTPKVRALAGVAA